MSRRIWSLVILGLLAAIASAGQAQGKVNRAAERVLGEYIVTLNAGTELSTVSKTLAARFGGSVITTYQGVNAFALRFPGSTAEVMASRLSEDPAVKRVEENAVARLAQTSWQNTLLSPPAYPSVHLWHLDRLDQTPGTRFDYWYGYCSVRTGSGVRIYVIDNGVDPTHTEFQGRVDSAPTLQTFLGPLALSGPYFSTDRAESSHGTSVASVAAGATFGVAKGATLVDVRVFDSAGWSTATRVLKALEWIYLHDSARQGATASVINMSFGLSRYEVDASAVNTMLATMVNDTNAKIKAVAAAGNAQISGGVWTAYDISWFVPANSPDVITVAGANRDSDTRWSGSNFGGVAFYAPAQWVESASTITKLRFPSLSRDLTRSELSNCYDPGYLDSCLSGTSFASPVVAGLVARYLQHAPYASKAAVVTHLTQEAAATTGVTISYNGHSAPLVGARRDCY